MGATLTTFADDEYYDPNAQTVRGLVNNSNFCYMNSIFQALASLKTFRGFVHNYHEYIQQVLHHKTTSTKEGVAAGVAEIEGHRDIIEEMETTLKALQPMKRSKLGGAIKIPERLALQFQLPGHFDAQQDAHEFLQHMMTVLFDDSLAELARLEGVIEASSYARNSNYQAFFAAGGKPMDGVALKDAPSSEAREKAFREEGKSNIWNDLTRSTVYCVRKPLAFTKKALKPSELTHFPVVTQAPLFQYVTHPRLENPFRGMIAMSNECQKCGARVWHNQPFHCLSLTFRPTLKSALWAYCSDEYIHDYRCESCNRKSMARRRGRLTRIPKVLCMHIQRCVAGALGMVKEQRPIQFDETFCLSNEVYTKLPGRNKKNAFSPATMSARGSGGSGATTSPAPSAAAATGELPRKETESHNFRLMSVIAHAGSSYGGHFYCYRRLAGSSAKEKDKEVKDSRDEEASWVRLSDREVYDVSLATVLDCEAYMLFYEKEEQFCLYVLPCLDIASCRS